MCNLFRKSIKIVAGLGLLLFLNNCTTLENNNSDKKSTEITLETLFPKERKSLIYLNSQDNKNLISSLIKSEELDKQSISIINKSKEIYAAFNQDLTTGMDVVLSGDYSKKTLEFGLFLSLNWKKVSKDGYSYWSNKKGVNIYFVGDEHIIMSTINILPLIKNMETNILYPPTESIVLILPNMDDEQIKLLSNGFIKGGIKSISLHLKKIDDFYELNSALGLESDSKAKAFSRLINIFLKLILSGSQDADIVRIGKEFQIRTEESNVIVDNITINDEFLIELINNIIFNTGEADK